MSRRTSIAAREIAALVKEYEAYLKEKLGAQKYEEYLKRRQAARGPAAQPQR